MIPEIDPQTKKELQELLSELGPDTPVLIIANLLTIVLAMVQGWSIVSLLWVYWFQNIIIGFFNWKRMRKLVRFSAEGVGGKTAQKSEPTGQLKTKMSWFFAGHYGFFHVIYLIFIVTVTRSFSEIATLSLALSITIFLFNHFYSYRYQLRKDQESCPIILNMMFLPYARVVPMHLIVFIGLMMGRGSSTELFLFLLLKTLVDLAMHLITQVNWKTDMDPGWAEHLKRAEEKSKKNTGKKHDVLNIRRTLKQRLKIWLLVGWVGFLALVLAGGFLMQEIGSMVAR